METHSARNIASAVVSAARRPETIGKVLALQPPVPLDVVRVLDYLAPHDEEEGERRGDRSRHDISAGVRPEKKSRARHGGDEDVPREVHPLEPPAVDMQEHDPDADPAAAIPGKKEHEEHRRGEEKGVEPDRGVECSSAPAASGRRGLLTRSISTS